MTIEANTEFATDSGLIFVNTNPVEISNGEGSGEVTAREVGAQYNVPENSIHQFAVSQSSLPPLPLQARTEVQTPKQMQNW